MGVEISVCIATWCRKDNLKKIIYILENQSLPQSKYEIIICDSFSDDGTSDEVKLLCEKFSNIKYINTDKNVLAVKRNIGIEAAESPIIVFMDDDVFPTETFVEAHLKAHSNTVNTVICGQVRFPQEWIEKSNYYRYRDDCHLGEKHKDILSDLPFNKIVVMNMSFRKKEVIEKVGLVCEDFIGYGCEDTEFGYRIKQSNLKLVYKEECLAYHHEKSPSIIAFGEKLYRMGRDGTKTLNKINQEILKNTQIVYFLDNHKNESIKFKIKKILYNLIINKAIAYMVGIYLAKTDGVRFLYNEKLYRYFLAYEIKQGILDQKQISLSLEDVRKGWYVK